MENFPKEYEDVFTNPRTLKKCKLDKVNTDKDINVDQYQILFRKTLSDFQQVLFDYWVKIAWLMRRYCYDGVKKHNHGDINRGRGWVLDSSFSIFMRHFVGFDNRFITRGKFFTKIAGYFDDFYPDFDTSNPFESEFKYPYKYMNLECLILVYQMPERLKLLEHGEGKKMGYLKFSDYIINYINCYNEKYKCDKFTFIFSRNYIPYVRLNKFYEGNNK